VQRIIIKRKEYYPMIPSGFGIKYIGNYINYNRRQRGREDEYYHRWVKSCFLLGRPK
jgi:hypothetical protein